MAARAKSASELVGKQVTKARGAKGWTQEELASELFKLGLEGWRQSKVAKIEAGSMERLALDDVIALAAVLEVQFAHLVAPEGGEIAVAPKLKRTPRQFRLWLRGFNALSPEAQRSYFTGPLVPEQEWREFVAGVEVAGGQIVAPGAEIETAHGTITFEKGDNDG